MRSLALIGLLLCAVVAHADCSDTYLTTNSNQLPPVSQGVPYSTTLYGSSGVAPFTVLQVYNLPSGLSVSGNTISGTTTATAGFRTISVEMEDANSNWTTTYLCMQITNFSGTYIYVNGSLVSTWADASSASSNYVDTSGAPTVSGPYDIGVTTAFPNQYWGAYSNCCSSYTLNASGYTYFIFSAKPTKANQTFEVFFSSTTNGLGYQSTATIATSYCSGGGNPTIGAWETCKVPLSTFSAGSGSFTFTAVDSVYVVDESSYNTNVFYLDNVGFSN